MGWLDWLIKRTPRKVSKSWDLPTFSPPLPDQDEEGRVKTYPLLRSCPVKFPDGEYSFLAWGPSWGYRFNEAGQWIKGKLCDRCGAPYPQICACGSKARPLGQHGGLDIMSPMKTPQVFPASGLILESGLRGKYGKRILVLLDDEMEAHDGTMKKFYLTGAHFDHIPVMKGQHVNRGEFAGLSGNSGNTGKRRVPHIHWQLEEESAWPRYPVSIRWVNA